MCSVCHLRQRLLADGKVTDHRVPGCPAWLALGTQPVLAFAAPGCSECARRRSLLPSVFDKRLHLRTVLCFLVVGGGWAVAYQAHVSCIRDQDIVCWGWSSWSVGTSGPPTLLGYRPLSAPLFGSLSVLVGIAADRSDDTRMRAANPRDETASSDYLLGSAQF